jgi:hypothetical protein
MDNTDAVKGLAETRNLNPRYVRRCHLKHSVYKAPRVAQENKRIRAQRSLIAV